MDTITITKAQLQAAIKEWEQENRDGKCMDADAARALSVDQVAEASTEHLWRALSQEAVQP